jgi:hypothetical protein
VTWDLFKRRVAGLAWAQNVRKGTTVARIHFLRTRSHAPSQAYGGYTVDIQKLRLRARFMRSRQRGRAGQICEFSRVVRGIILVSAVSPEAGASLEGSTREHEPHAASESTRDPNNDVLVSRISRIARIAQNDLHRPRLAPRSLTLGTAPVSRAAGRRRGPATQRDAPVHIFPSS